MLDDISEFIRDCLLRAAEYRYTPPAPDDPDAPQHFHDMEVRWLDLAMDYEFASRLPRTLAA